MNWSAIGAIFLALGVGLGGAALTVLVGAADWPPHPAKRATIKTRRPVHTTAFSFLISGNSFQVAGLPKFRRWRLSALLKSTVIQSRCGIVSRTLPSVLSGWT